MTVLLEQAGWASEPAKVLSQEIADVMFQVAGNHPAYLPVRAKGIVRQGTFRASKSGRTVSHAAHFQGATIPVTVRFSDGAADPTIADSSPNAAPRGMAIRFTLPGGHATDIVAMSLLTESFFSNNACVFVNKKEQRQSCRYQILPVAGSQYLDDAAAK